MMVKNICQQTKIKNNPNLNLSTTMKMNQEKRSKKKCKHLLNLRSQPYKSAKPNQL